MEEEIWERLYQCAAAALRPRTVSPFVEAGGVASAILSKSGAIYTGVCIDTACTLGMCAERNAISTMLTQGEHEITKLVCVMADGTVGFPCGACRELLMQLSKNSPDIEILTDYTAKTTVRLHTLMPNWWGTARFEREEACKNG